MRESIGTLYGQKIAILGFDREGKAVFDFLTREKEFHGAEIWVLDAKKDIEVPKGVRSRLGPGYLSRLEDFDLIFRTPGARYYSKEVQKALKDGSEISSGTKLFFDRCPGTIIGVTGTKGKGTTTTLVYEMLKAAEKKAFIAGNIGKPALEILPELDKQSFAVLELSSFQLIDLEKSPHVGVALMVTQEHLDWHKDVKEYVAAKSSIVKFQNKNDVAVLAADYPRTMSYAALAKGKVLTFSRRKKIKRGAWVEKGHFYFKDGLKRHKIAATSDVKIPGEHNWENICAAICAAKALKVPTGAIRKAITNFKGLEHRLEFVAKKNGVRYYNDSYSTTPETAIVAIQAFTQPKVLILGGSYKGSDFTELGKIISSSNIRAIIGIGVEWPRIKAKIRNKAIPVIENCKNMEEIMEAASWHAKPGDVVLLSPACASFGMFKNYTERGKQFKEGVKRLK